MAQGHTEKRHLLYTCAFDIIKCLSVFHLLSSLFASLLLSCLSSFIFSSSCLVSPLSSSLVLSRLSSFIFSSSCLVLSCLVSPLSSSLVLSRLFSSLLFSSLVLSLFSCLVFSCLVLSCLVLSKSCLVSSCLVLSKSRLVLSCLVSSRLVSSRLVLSCLVLSCLVLSCLVSLSLSCSFAQYTFTTSWLRNVASTELLQFLCKNAGAQLDFIGGDFNMSAFSTVSDVFSDVFSTSRVCGDSR